MRRVIPAVITQASPSNDQYVRHAQRVFAAYEDLFTKEDRASGELLYLLSLFDRPAPRSLIDIVVRASIPGINAGLHLETFDAAVDELEQLSLVSCLGTSPEIR